MTCLDLVEGLGLNEFCALVARDESAVGLDSTAAVAVDLEQPRNVELGLLHDLHLAHKHVLGASEERERGVRRAKRERWRPKKEKKKRKKNERRRKRERETERSSV